MSSMSSVAVQRLRKDAARLAKDPIPFVLAVPLPSNILEWHYIVQGPPDSLYAGGIYHGKLIFPKEYPFKPPSIYMLTPNGRFQVNTRLCLSISDFHPDTWNPAWSVGTILTGLLSFMLETTPTLGSIESTDYEKRQYAGSSAAHNLRSKTFRDLFPELCEELQREINERVQASKKSAAALLESLTAANTGQSVAKTTTSSPTSNEKNQIAGDQRRTVGNDSNGEENKNIGVDGEQNGANPKPQQAATKRGGGAHGNNNGNNNNLMGGILNTSAISNLLVFAGVVAFVFVAKYVLQTAD